MPSSVKDSKWLMLSIFALALALRSIPVWVHQWTPEFVTIVDSARYLELTDRLVSGAGFSLQDPVSGEILPEQFRTPGYPLVLALASSLSMSLAWVLAFQVLVDALAAVACFWLVASWSTRSTGAFAAVLFAFDPAHVVYSNLLMADIFCGAAIAAGLVLLEYASRRPGNNSAAPGHLSALLILAGVCLTIATTLRPVALLLWVPAAIFLRWRRVGRRAVVGFVAAALLFPVVWSTRNARIADGFTVSTAFDVNLALVFAAKVEARRVGTSRAEGERSVMARVADRQQTDDVAFHHACRTIGLETVLQAPVAATVEIITSAAEMLLAGERRYLYQVLGRPLYGPGLGDVGRETVDLVGLLVDRGFTGGAVLTVQVLMMAVIWTLAAFGILTLWRQGQHEVVVLCVLSLMVVLAPSLVVGSGRLRLPVTLLIYGLAGVGGARAFGWREYRSRVVR